MPKSAPIWEAANSSAVWILYISLPPVHWATGVFISYLRWLPAPGCTSVRDRGDTFYDIKASEVVFIRFYLLLAPLQIYTQQLVNPEFSPPPPTPKVTKSLIYAIHLLTVNLSSCAIYDTYHISRDNECQNNYLRQKRSSSQD